MIVRPDEMRASSAPCTSPLNSCDRKLAQLTTLDLAHDEPHYCGDQVLEPNLHPNASGACIRPSPGTTLTTSQKSSGFFMSLAFLPLTMTTGRMHWWSSGR